MSINIKSVQYKAILSLKIGKKITPQTLYFVFVGYAGGGELIGFAPNFDNNMALISRGYPLKPKPSDMLIVLFNELMEEYPEYKRYIPAINETILRTALEKVNMKVKSQEIMDLILSRYNLIDK